ncbi:MAG: hypothetical protein ABL934_14675 [Lysobacteraceae bacterium]
MTFIRPLSCLALGLSLTLGAFAPAHAASATQQLQYLDKTTYSGYLDVAVSLYDPPGKDGKYGAAKRYPAQLLFERPGRFRLVLRPGAKEYRAVADAGIVRWLDLATGLSGKGDAAKIVDPLTLGLLGTAGELLRFSGGKDLPLPSTSKVSAARLAPKTWATSVDSGTAWLSSDGKPIGFEFILADRTKVFVSVLLFKQNVPTKPGDFQL